MYAKRNSRTFLPTVWLVLLAMLVTILPTPSFAETSEGSGDVSASAADGFFAMRYTEDFEDGTAVVNEVDRSFTSSSGWSGVSEGNRSYPTRVMTEGGVLRHMYADSINNEYNKGSAYRISSPEALTGVDDYTFTGELLCEGQSRTYYTVIFCPDAPRFSLQDLVMFKVNQSSLQIYTLDENRKIVEETSIDTTREEQAHYYDAYVGQWISFECVRNGLDFSVTFWPLKAADGKNSALAITQTIQLHDTYPNGRPGLRLQADSFVTKHTTVTLDNLEVRCRPTDSQLPFAPALPPHGAVAENFDMLSMTEAGLFWQGGTDWSSYLEGGSGHTTLENGRLVYQNMKNAKYRIYAPNTLVSSSYCFTGDVFIDSLAKKGYFCIFVRPEKTNNYNAARIMVGISSVEMAFISETGSNIVSPVSLSPTQYVGKQLCFSFVRKGGDYSFSLWVKGQENDTKQTITHHSDIGAAATPGIRLQADSRDLQSGYSKVYLDNLSIQKHEVGCLQTVGTQVSVAVSDSYAVRFVAATNSQNYGTMGFLIRASFADGTKQTWKLSADKAHGAIVGNTVNGIQTYLAKDLGGSYLFTATVADLPISKGDARFEVQAFEIAEDGSACYYDVIRTCTATVTDTGTVSTGKINTQRYDADTISFASLSDLRRYAELYRAQAPLTRTTRGYRTEGDGGAATYRIVTERPSGVCETIANGLWAVIETESGSVTPQMFGAYGNGVRDDSGAMSRAIGYAVENGLELVLPEVEYYCSSPTVFENITVRSQNAKISYWGLTASVAAVDVKDNVNIYGTLHIWSYDNTRNGISNHGGRCGLGFGYYGSGEGSQNCYIEHVVVTGGFRGTNAVFITGDSNNITIDRVTVPSGTNYWRAVLAHWGNANDHWPIREEGNYSYGHAEDWEVSQHARNVHIGLVECWDLIHTGTDGDNDKGAVVLSAVYDFRIDEIVIDNSAFAVSLIPGDMGFDYATAEEKAHGQKNISIGKITATNIRNCGIYSCAYTGYIAEADSKTQLTVEQAHITMAPGYRAHGMAVHQNDLVRINKLTLVGCKTYAVYVGAGTENVEIDELILEDCTAQGLYFASKIDKEDNRRVTVNSLKVQNSGAATYDLIYAARTRDILIGSIELTDSTYRSVFSLGEDVFGTVARELTLQNSTLAAIVYARNAITEEHRCALGDLRYGDIPQTMGSAVTFIKVSENFNA